MCVYIGYSNYTSVASKVNKLTNRIIFITQPGAALHQGKILVSVQPVQRGLGVRGCGVWGLVVISAVYQCKINSTRGATIKNKSRCKFLYVKYNNDRQTFFDLLENLKKLKEKRLIETPKCNWRCKVSMNRGLSHHSKMTSVLQSITVPRIFSIIWSPITGTSVTVYPA